MGLFHLHIQFVERLQARASNSNERKKIEQNWTKWIQLTIFEIKGEQNRKKWFVLDRLLDIIDRSIHIFNLKPLPDIDSISFRTFFAINVQCNKLSISMVLSTCIILKLKHIYFLIKIYQFYTTSAYSESIPINNQKLIEIINGHNKILEYIAVGRLEKRRTTTTILTCWLWTIHKVINLLFSIYLKV